MVSLLIPISAGILYALGGQVNKWFRWLMGLPIGIIAFFCGHDIVTIPITTFTYWVATSWFPYGEKSWLNFLGEWGKFFVCGFIFGLASFPILGAFCILQAIAGGLGFIIIKLLDDQGAIQNPTTEFLRGVAGTGCYL